MKGPRFKDDDIRDAVLAVVVLIVFEACVWAAGPESAKSLATPAAHDDVAFIPRDGGR